MADKVVHVPETPDAVPPDPKTVEELRKEQDDEWGVYVASGPIDINGIRAFNKGDAVPAAHVDSGVVDSGAVAKRSTKAGQAVTNPEK